MAYCSVTDVKQAAGITASDTDYDAEIKAIIDDHADSYINIKIRPYETFPITDSTKLSHLKGISINFSVAALKARTPGTDEKELIRVRRDAEDALEAFIEAFYGSGVLEVA